MLEPPGHYLCTPEPGWSVCVISIQKDVNATSAEKRLLRKRNCPLYIPHCRDFKQYSQNACFCMCSLWPIFLIMDNTWTKLITGLYVFHKEVSIFVHCDLDLSSLTLKINRDYPLTMDNKCTCTKFDQD